MYELPQFLKDSVSEEQYRKWLDRRADAHYKRDRKRGNKSAHLGAYKKAIHSAVLKSGGVDAYTGQSLRWDQIGRYDNEESKARGREYNNKERGDAPTVDHVGDGKGEPEFLICSSRTNKAKSDLNQEEFVSLCESVLAHSRKRQQHQRRT